VGATVLSVHYEASIHLHRTLNAIREAGMKAGVAINPHTPVSSLTDLLNDIDLVCMMSVNPGYGGQKFIERTYERCRELSRNIQAARSNCLIEIDGGVNADNISPLLSAGANVLVAGNFVFTSSNPSATIATLKAARPDTQRV
jgi:ribulose-phosphate 3-epimerase